jgi:hypothetical protein
MFADRTTWNLQRNRITQAISRYQEAGRPFYDLTESNPTQCRFDYPGDRILDAFSTPENLRYEPTAQGIFKAREAVSEYYRSKDITVDPDNLFLTASTSEAYSLLFRLLADPYDSVWFPRPSYPLFHFLGDINDIRLGFYDLIFDTKWHIPDTFWESGGARGNSKALVMVNPNNPTGSIIGAHERDRIVANADIYGACLISDEVFSDFLFAPQAPFYSFAAETDVLTFTLGGLSKTMGLPQMKLSWIVISGPQRYVAQARERLEVIADTFLSVNTPVQNALPALFSVRDSMQRQMNQRIRCNLDHLKDLVQGQSEVNLLEGEGGWYVVLELTRLEDEEKFIMDLIERQGVLVHPGYFYDFDRSGIIVLSLIVEPSVFQEGMLRIMNNYGKS